MKKYRCLILLLFLVLPAYSQWKKIALSNTGPIYAQTILSAIIDNDNNIWFGTEQGLWRYNRLLYSWENYTTSDGLPDNLIRILFKDKDGSIWIGTDKGLSRFASNQFNNYGTHEGLSSNLIRSITQQPNGKIFIGTFDGGICSYTQPEGFKKILLPENDSYILSMLALSDTSILISSFKGGLLLYNNDTTMQIANPGEYFGKTAYCMTRTFDGSIWIGTDNGAQEYIPAENRILPSPDSLLGKMVYTISGNDSSGILFASVGKIYQNSKGKWSINTPPVSKATAIYTLIVDSKNIWWTGGSSQGIFFYHEKKWLSSIAIGLHVNSCRNICEDKDHNMWFATHNGIYRYDGGLWIRLLITDYGSDNLKVACDRSGMVWLLRNGILYSYEENEWKSHQHDTIFGEEQIAIMKTDPSGNLWVAFDSRGLFKYDGKLWNHFYDGGLFETAMDFYPNGNPVVISPYGTLVIYDSTGYVSSAMNGNFWINDMAIGRDSTIWLASENGILKYKNDVVDSKFIGNTFYHIQIDKFGSVWAGEAGGGTRRFDGENWTFFPLNAEIPFTYLNDIFVDSDEKIWLATDHGIYVSDIMTGIPEIEKDSELPVIFESPFSNILEMKITTDEPAIALVQFYGADGRIISSVSINLQAGVNYHTFESSSWPDGMIICRMISGGKIWQQKLIRVSVQ